MPMNVRVAAQTSDMMFDRTRYFDSVRASLFPSGMTQQQVDGQEAILTQWETGERQSDDLRHLSYMLATTRHETAGTCWPISEYGAPTCGGASYAKEDPPGSGNRFYGRGYVQLTWADNYKRATKELELTGDNDLYKHPDKALDPQIAADVMFRGMWEGWFRSPNTLFKFFNDDTNDPFNAREIINGDRNYHVNWDSRTIGQIIASYHDEFLDALEDSVIDVPAPQPRPPRPPLPPLPPLQPLVVAINITEPWGTRVDVEIVQGPPPDWDALRRRYEQWRTGTTPK